MQGLKHGQGHYTWSDGSEYNGLWQSNKINGLGVYNWSDGRKYFGFWLNNDMHGLGIYIYQDGIRYEGYFQADKKEGFGIYYWTDGRKYEGQWHKAKQHGIGIYTDPNKNIHKKGLWEMGKRKKWYTDEEADLINNHEYDLSADVTEPAMFENMNPSATFIRPADFESLLEKIR